ncbi:MAG: zf-HC2 domain-containing protein [Elusimicrobiota bacterium]|jgi:hypothetical protein
MKPLKCRQLLKHLSSYLDREIDPALCRHIESHIQGCRPCVAFISTLKKTVAVLKRQPAAAPPARLKQAWRRRLPS